MTERKLGNDWLPPKDSCTKGGAWMRLQSALRKLTVEPVKNGRGGLRAAVAIWGQLWGHLAGRDLQLIININHLLELFDSRLAYHS